MIASAKPTKSYNHTLGLQGHPTIEVHSTEHLVGAWMEMGLPVFGGEKAGLTLQSYELGGQCYDCIAYSDGQTGRHGAFKFAASLSPDGSVDFQLATTDDAGNPAVKFLSLAQLEAAIKLYLSEPR